MSKVVIVLAGNAKEFAWYRSRVERRERDTEYVYGESVHSIMGMLPYDVATVGTFWVRSDAGDLFDYAQERLRVARLTEKKI